MVLGELSIGKTKELVVDFRRSRKPPTPITIQGVAIETVDSYKQAWPGHRAYPVGRRTFLGRRCHHLIKKVYYNFYRP